MLLSMFLLLTGIALLFMILTIKWQSLSIGAVDIILWMTLSQGVMNLDIPYQLIKSDDTVATGVHTISDLWFLNWFFMLMALIMMLYLFISIIYPMLQQKFSKVM